MQHDVFVNPGRRNRAIYPFITVLQADVVDGPSKLVCPLRRPMGVSPTRSMPAVDFAGIELLLPLELVFSVPARALGRPLGSIASYRDEIVYALDWLFTGI